jgi:NAD(P)-dependent dehydrogenase (short-subunit alcohol dehydrogenase family)
MPRSVLITGCSSGIGRAAAERFSAEGWRVFATMRNPADGAALANLPGLTLLALDVSSDESVRAAVAAAEAAAGGGLDLVVNNAGFGAFGPFETAPDDLIDRQIETNLKGVMRVTRAALPGMRKKGSGVVINVSSIGGLVTMPLNSIYHAVKFAVVGFSEALNYELAPFGVTAKVVCPGGVATDFAGRSLSRTFDGDGGAYGETIAKVFNAFRSRSGAYSTGEDIAAVIFGAATDGTRQVVYLAGADAVELEKAHSAMASPDYLAMMEARFGLA